MSHNTAGSWWEFVPQKTPGCFILFILLSSHTWFNSSDHYYSCSVHSTSNVLRRDTIFCTDRHIVAHQRQEVHQSDLCIRRVDGYCGVANPVGHCIWQITTIAWLSGWIPCKLNKGTRNDACSKWEGRASWWSWGWVNTGRQTVKLVSALCYKWRLWYVCCKKSTIIFMLTKHAHIQ